MARPSDRRLKGNMVPHDPTVPMCSLLIRKRNKGRGWCLMFNRAAADQLGSDVHRVWMAWHPESRYIMVSLRPCAGASPRTAVLGRGGQRCMAISELFGTDFQPADSHRLRDVITLKDGVWAVGPVEGT